MNTLVDGLAAARVTPCGTLAMPGDKSITHRAFLLGALAAGTTTIRNPLRSEDIRATRDAIARIGAVVHDAPHGVTVFGLGGRTPIEPAEVIDCLNSGTTARLFLGLAAGLGVSVFLTGDRSLLGRPMRRVIEPLVRMGALIVAREGKRLPIAVRGGALKGVSWRPEAASAQVKSAILLAGLQARGETAVIETVATRDHTERMLRGFGAKCDVVRDEDGRLVTRVRPGALRGCEVDVPGDLSSAAFFLVLAALVPGSRVGVTNVGLNPGRTGILDLLRAVGANVTVTDEREIAGEPRGTVTVAGGAARLEPTDLHGAMIPRIVDELPIAALLLARAAGRSEIREASELRVKESDRLAGIARMLATLGVRTEDRPEGLAIHGVDRFTPGDFKSDGDHRMAMAQTIGALVSNGRSRISGTDAVDVSFPGFFQGLESLGYDPAHVFPSEEGEP